MEASKKTQKPQNKKQTQIIPQLDFPVFVLPNSNQTKTVNGNQSKT